MHHTVNYSKSPAPSFDAVNDIQEWFGDRYERLAEQMRFVTDCELFALLCSFAGVSGFPVKAWYEHFHGQGSWKDPN